MLPPWLPDEPRRLLILRTGSLGDIVHALPAVWALHRRFPSARIEWLVEGRWAPILHDVGCLDGLVELPLMPGKGPWVRGIRETVAVAGLRTRKYDIAVDFQGLLRTAVWTRIVRARACVGPDDWREVAPLFYSRILSRGRAAHVVDQGLAMAAALSATDGRVEFGLRPSDSALRASVDALEGEAGVARRVPRWAVLFPRTSAPAKDWSADRWGVVAHWLASEVGLGVLVAGGVRERAACEGVVMAARSHVLPDEAVLSPCTVPLEQLRTLLAGASLVVGGDSGPVHWAAAMGTPVLSLFGPTDPARSRPKGAGRIAVLRRDEACRACAVVINRKGDTWPWGPSHTCMAAIGVDDVCVAVRSLLG